MTAFNEVEQLDYDLEWFSIDKDGRIGQFLTGGFRLLPPSVAKSKQNLEKLKIFFEGLPIKNNSYTVNPNLQRHLDIKSVRSFDGYIKPFAELSLRGLYAFDSEEYTSNNRPYFLVTLPLEALKLEELPDEIRAMLMELRLNEIRFDQDWVIDENTVNKL